MRIKSNFLNFLQKSCQLKVTVFLTSIDQGCRAFVGKGPQLSLWAGSRAARVKKSQQLLYRTA